MRTLRGRWRCAGSTSSRCATRKRSGYQSLESSRSNPRTGERGRRRSRRRQRRRFAATAAIAMRGWATTFTNKALICLAAECRLTALVADLFSCLQVNVRLKRLVAYHLIQFFAPSAFVTIVSWTAFWLDRRALNARITLWFTTLLSLFTVSQQEYDRQNKSNKQRKAAKCAAQSAAFR